VRLTISSGHFEELSGLIHESRVCDSYGSVGSCTERGTLTAVLAWRAERDQHRVSERFLVVRTARQVTRVTYRLGMWFGAQQPENRL
jgi:hypothetical protein